MYSKKKTERPKRSRDGNLSQYGLFDIPTDLSLNDGDDGSGSGGDSDLEAELLAITSGSNPSRPARRKPKPTVNLDSMVKESLKDIPSDEELSGDDDDPDLLNELSEITNDEFVEEIPQESSPTNNDVPNEMLNLLQERLKMYELAQSNAKEAGESSRAKRFGRGISTIKDLIKTTNSGKPINKDDIPPEVTVNTQKREPPVEPTRPAPLPPSAVESPVEEDIKTVEMTDDSRSKIALLNERKDEYKNAALRAKKSGNVPTALTYVKIIKQFDFIIKAIENGETVDLSNMPGPPVDETRPKEEIQVQTQNTEEPIDVKAIEEQEVQLIPASSVGEALQQRLDIYKEQEQAAKEQGNSSKARRMGRIVKQYENAIKLNNQGKPIPVDELPTPPGYAPIPVPGAEKPPAPEVSKPVAPTPPPRDSPSTKPAVPARTSGNHIPTTRMEKQIILLKDRQREFKEAALNAKKKGEINQAKEYLRNAKRIDPLIEAAQGGLPVDISSLPIPPSAKSQLDLEYELVMADECVEDDAGVMDVISRLEAQLTKQLKMCLTTRDHHKALGDVAGTNRFERLALSVTKDLDLVRIAKRTNGAAIPKFHHESRNFSIVKSFTDLNDNDLQLSIISGINYNCANPKDIDTYVKFEFPYPQEEPYRDKTSTIKDTNNPAYNADFIIPIQRTSRPCLRVFKRHAVKLEVFSKGGFFRSDSLLGTATVKLQPLETQCEIHESFDLMDGRKKVGGKLEVRIRVRDPLISKEVQQLSERWLVVDH
ncbi:PREDICTED: coiled-coil and C2 domain-containing protein 1-like isoform X2 [Nicrophorus vespilloides]|uniref:Coiled-coil and C2 domain-containing protein 1-like isoform X2 n=1 Tax=Nicrophorus vespilloides TaxID=110193 RepID=A0ABM1MVP9_NICVS|nr:PREDICTED: coiled-coil and C2 domain-containing protein 1-like isoform X2 [Nicrophorus vespilloides]